MTSRYRHELPAPYDRGTYPITVTVAQAAAGTVLHTGRMRLNGWSLSSTQVDTLQNEAEVTSPAAGATIVSIAGIPAGDYTVAVILQLAGTVGGPELNNFQLFNGAALVPVLTNNPAVGEYPQPLVVLTIAAAGTVSIKTNVLSTVGAQYTASIVLTPLAAGAIAQVFDAGQPLGNVSTGADQIDTQWFGDDGIYVGTSIAVKASSGNISGVVWVCDDPVGLEVEEPSRLSSSRHRP